jgi:hypothetical protein
MKRILKTIFGVNSFSETLIRLKHSFYSGSSIAANAKEEFINIYEKNSWGSQESKSGPGSHINTTKIIRSMLPILWDEYSIKSMLDAPCGDYNWMQAVPKERITYIGGDIVPKIIEHNTQKYTADNVTFCVLDITQDALPCVDMIFCKDCLQHLCYASIFKALRNFKQSGAKYLLTSNYPLTLRNWDIADGGYRPLNLRRKPFCLPPPLAKIHETSQGIGVEMDKFMYLYKLDDVKIPY